MQAVCGVPIAQIRAGIDAGDEFVVPFCLRELTTILALLRTWGLHPDNIDENLNPRHLSNVAIEAARSGTLYTTIQGTTAATQTYIVAQYERLVRALVDFAYLHNAIVLRNGVYSWDNDRLPLWTHRPAAVEQWLKSKGCPIGPHHFVRPVHWVMASMDGFKRHPAGRSGMVARPPAPFDMIPV